MRRLIAVALLCCGPVAGQACGDCDGSGFVNVLDALLAAQTHAGRASLQSPFREACDVFPAGGDQTITVLDSLWIAQYVVGHHPALVCTPPTGMILEDFLTTAGMDPATTADWGQALPGYLQANLVAGEVEAHEHPSSASSIPMQGAGRRLQLLYRPQDLGGAGGPLMRLAFVLGANEENGRTYQDLEVRACHTTTASLETSFAANYTGQTPQIIKPPATEVYGPALVDDQLDLRISPGVFTYNGVDNLLIEIIHRGATAETVLQVTSGLVYIGRVHSADPDGHTGFTGSFGYHTKLTFAGHYAATSEGISVFHDTGRVYPIIHGATSTAAVPAGTQLTLSYQGAPDDGGGQPDLGLVTPWVPDSTWLTGMRFIRFRAQLHATPLATPRLSVLRIPYD
jgi:hypothetical protein